MGFTTKIQKFSFPILEHHHREPTTIKMGINRTSPTYKVLNCSILEHSSSKSSAKQRAKVEKQIAKASRKHAKHNPQARTKLKKDPGVPSKFPFKDKLIREIEQGRQNQENERQRQREHSRQHHLQSQARPSEGAMDLDNSGIARLAQAAEERDLEYEDGVMAVHDVGEVESSAKRDTSRKAYNKEFKKVIEQADVILYILDARDPEGTRSREIEKSIRGSPNGEKHLLLVLNKIGSPLF